MAERRGKLELLPGGSAGVWEVLPATLPQLVKTCLQDVLDLAGTPLAATIKDAARIKERHRRSTGPAHSTADGTDGATSEEIRSMGLYLAEMPCRVVHKLKPRFVQLRLGLTGDGC